MLINGIDHAEVFTEKDIIPSSCGGNLMYNVEVLPKRTLFTLLLGNVIYNVKVLEGEHISKFMLLNVINNSIVLQEACSSTARRT